MTSPAAVAFTLLAMAASDEGRPEDRSSALAWDATGSGARAGRESTLSLVPAFRGDADVGAGLRRDLTRQTIWIAPAIGAQLMMHESAHALIPLLRGDPTLRVRFFPNVGAGRFGDVTWSREGPAAFDALSSAMPKLLDLALITAAGRAKRSARAPWSRGLLGALQIVALGDFLVGTLVIWRPPGPWNDAWYLAQRLDEAGVRLGKGGARAAMTALAAAGVALCAATW